MSTVRELLLQAIAELDTTVDSVLNDVSQLTAYNFASPARFDDGLILEGASTNQLWPSAVFTNSRWIKSNAVFSGGYLVDSTENGFHEIYQAVNVSPNQPYCCSAQVKAVNSSKGRIWFVSSSIGYYADFDLIAGTITNASNFGSGVGIKSFIKPLENGWFEVAVSGYTNLSTGYFDIAMRSDAGAVQYVGTGKTMQIRHAQFEAGKYPTSKIETTTQAATRTSDGIFRNFLPFSEIIIKAHTARYYPTDYAVLMHLDNNQNNANYEDIELFQDYTGALILRATKNNTQTYDINFGVYPPDADFDMTITLNGSVLAGALNNGVPIKKVIPQLNLTHERWGYNMTGARAWGGILKKLIIG